MEACKRLINLGLSFLSLALTVAIFAYFWLKHFQYSLVDDLRFFRNGYILEIAIYGVVLYAFSKLYGGTRLGYLKNSEIIFSQVFATVIADVIIYGQLSLMAKELFYYKLFIWMFLMQAVVLVLYTSIANRLYRRMFPPRKLLLLHGERPTDGICAKFETRKDKYLVTRNELIREDMQQNYALIMEAYQSGECNAVVIWDVPTKERNKLLKFCYAQSIRVYMMPKITDVIMTGAEELHVFDSPMLLTREYSLTMEQRFLKRAIDIICSLILIIITSPIMLITALIIKLSDKGPVFYKQVRCTIGQKEFEIIKFRSMRVDAEKDGKARLAQKNDDRITPVGKVIRKCRIDELPQLFNILKGDMSFIGPRPERPDIIAQYLEVMPEFVYRMKVKAGLAGFAQVYGKYNTTPYDKLKLDLTYIENYSVWLDVKLMILTLKVLFLPDSTEGVDAEQITALREEKLAKEEKAQEQKEGA
ncbi:MAG: exopolysaccharide biosynthesis polyprenyl glycosylphosphotransferase [Lachnospiraceae bacterium]|nr:exopolysaccharide biosynthesis polyprenyl glycosylphosphotransferase [Lachnospiraceae bacterium]MBP5282826.1 exopolysaccharide biosynthesis polyprenyl glycosylphosphotransferase [Lachnospiraceae bacterium]